MESYAMMHSIRLAIVFSFFLIPVSGMIHADEIPVKTAVTNLESPTGVAVQPGTGHVFIASRFGVYRYDPKRHQISLEIEGYPTDVYGKEQKYSIGPLGVAFLSESQLVVADGSRVDGEELVRVYEVGKESLETPIKEASAKVTLGPVKASEQSEKGEGNFYGVAVGDNRIFVTCNGDDTKGWVARSVVKDGKPGDLELSINTKEATGVDAPAPVTFTPDGKELVVGQIGEMATPKDSLLTFYNPADGKLIRKLETGLSDLSGLAYSPKTGKLYGTEFGWLPETEAGVYELVIGEGSVTAKKIVSLDKPAGLAFGPDGRLYVGVFGTVKEGSTDSPGTLVILEAGL